MIIKLLIIGLILVGGTILIIPVDADAFPETSSFTDLIGQKATYLKDGIIKTGNSILEYFNNNLSF